MDEILNQNTFEEDEPQISLKDYYRILYRGRWIILVSFLVVMVATIYFTFTAVKIYEANVKIIVESKGTMERALFDMTSFGNQTTLISNQVEILQSRYLAENVVRYLEASPARDSIMIFQPNDDGELLSFRVQAGWIMGNLAVNPKKDTDVIEIVFSANSPFEAKTICNAIAERYLELNSDYNKSEFTTLRKFLEHQREQKGEELRISEEALKNFRQLKKLVALDESTSELVTRLAEAESKMEAAQVELNATLEAKKSIEAQLEERKKSFSEETATVSSSLFLGLQEEYARLVAEKLKYETLISQDRVDPSNFNAEVLAMEEKIKAIQKKLREEANKIANSSMISDPLKLSQDLVTKLLEKDTEIKVLTSQLKTLRQIVENYNNQIGILPDNALQLARLERSVKVDQVTYMMINEKLEETRISEAGQKENIRILDYANRPISPVKPKKKLNLLLGLIIGLGLGVGITFLMEYMDNTIKLPNELEKLGYSVLATIPIISTDEVEKKIKEKELLPLNGENDIDLIEGRKIETRLITHFDPKSPISEAYRTLRTNFQFSRPDSKLKSLLVTSSGPKEGKSTTVANLAITIAQMGHKTVLVDTDLRRPVMHHIFNLKKENGVTDYLVNKTQLNELVKPTIIDNLYLVSSGTLPPNPAELLTSDSMKEMISELKENFDLVLFDSPPVIAVTDAQILSTEVDGTILVVKSEQTNWDMLNRSLSLLKNVKADLLGFVFNSVNVSKSYGSYYYYYYYHYYQYYGSDLKRRKKK